MTKPLTQSLIIAFALALSGCAALPVTAPVTLPQPPAVSEVRETEDLQDVTEALKVLPTKTLVVFDIDDTTLTAEQFFGSDYWYEWQRPENLGKSEKVSCKFDYIALNYEAQTMKPTQGDAAEIFNAIPHDKLFLTSRSPNYRGATERELLKNGITMPANLDGSPVGRMWDWSSDDGKHKVPLSYHHGLFMTQGQDKGVMLLFLLKQTQRMYDHVILVDDGKVNIDNMRKALASAGVNYTGFHYTRIHKPFPINPELADQADTDFEQSRKYLKEVFPTRYEELQRGECSY